MTRRAAGTMLRDTGVRRDYVLTPEEFDQLGGHDPDAWGCTNRPKDSKYAGWRTGAWYNPRCDKGVPAVGNVTAIWAKVAERTGVHLLTIVWPDYHYPEFTAVPR